MADYDLKCMECEYTFSVEGKLGTIVAQDESVTKDGKKIACPECGSKKVQKVFAPLDFRFACGFSTT